MTDILTNAAWLALATLFALLSGAWVGIRFANAGRTLDDTIAQFHVDSALVNARHAAKILESPPENLDAGYTDDELAMHYAAADRLLAAFRELEMHLELDTFKN